MEDKNLLVIGAPESDPAAYKLSGFLAPDAVISLRVAGKGYLAVSALEYGRAEKEANVDELLSFEELGIIKLSRELKSGAKAYAAAIADLLKKLGANAVTVPPEMGVVYADELRARGVEVHPDAKVFTNMRRTKTEAEISSIQKAQRDVEAATAQALDVLRESEVSEDGALVWQGETLTSELLRAEIDVALLRRGCVAQNTIVAGGAQGADPHNRGSGPLRAGEPIIIDVFPMDAGSRYHADMTRTVVKGEPDEELQKMYDAVLESQEVALDAIRAGADGQKIHERVSEVLHGHGYKTTVHDQEEGKPLTEGFFHGTGHGVGLEVHEAPRISVTGQELKTGDVVTVEPGVYRPGFGGVRIEDLVVVTDDGCRNLTDFPKELRL